MKLGLEVYGNDGGLGNQTRRLTYMLKPSRILLINAKSFSKNKQHHKEWYTGFSGYTVDGFPNNREINVFLKGLTHVLVCENPLNFYMFARAKQLGIKTYCQSNYEFCNNLIKPHLPLPDVFVMPSYWHVETMKEKYGEDRVLYLPPPINPNDFKDARETNFKRHGRHLRFLHIVGTLAVHDRNGTLDLLNSLKHTKADFELVIKSQHGLPQEYVVEDKRVIYTVGNVEDAQDMYRGFDAIIIPRRYGGLSLTTNEALMSGLPVIMPDISPNNKLLPKEWLVKARKKGEFFTRATIEIHESNLMDLARKLDWLVEQDQDELKIHAFDLGYNNFSETVLAPEYEKLWQK